MRQILLAAGMLFVAAACHEQRRSTMNEKEVRQAFLRESAAQSLRVIRQEPDGTIVVDRNGTELTVSLDNLVRDVARDNDPAAIGRFVTSIRNSALELPEWNAAQQHIRIAAEPSDHEFGDMIHERVTDSVERVLVYVTPDESRITWIDNAQLRQWHVISRSTILSGTLKFARLARKKASSSLSTR